MDKPVIPWLDRLKESDFVTEKLPYIPGKYFDLFEERLFKTNDNAVGDLRYYVYDPTEHGYSKHATYPVIYAFHGSSASLYGITAVNWAGVEYFASTEYQKKMGGAYIICPLANEYKEGEETKHTWMTPLESEASELIDSETTSNSGNLKDYSEETIKELRITLGEGAERLFTLLGTNSVYTKHLKALFDEAVSSFTCAGKTVVFGTSAGGYCAWRYIITYAVDAALIMAPAYLPSYKELELLEARSTNIWICQGVADELVAYDFSVKPILEKLKSMKNVSLYLPELVRMPDRGVYSNPAGIEMGQHCINNAAQCDFMYEDGTPMDENHPQGVTGWIKAIKDGDTADRQEMITQSSVIDSKPESVQPKPSCIPCRNCGRC